MGAAAGGAQAEERPGVLQLAEASPECLVGGGTETGLTHPGTFNAHGLWILFWSRC